MAIVESNRSKSLFHMTMADMADLADRRSDAIRLENADAFLAPALRGAIEGSETPQRLARRALELAPGLDQVEVVDAWYGFRPMMADGLPVAGETPIGGLYVHGGHGSLGMQAAPATARWLAERMTGTRATDERPWLNPMRFSEAR